MTLTRRDFVIRGLAATGGLLIGCTHSRTPQAGVDASGAAIDAPVTLNDWLEIPVHGDPVFVMGFAEMGQGSLTGLAMALCEELDFPLDRMRFRLAPASKNYAHPLLGAQITGGSATISGSFLLMRTLGAGTRDVLLQAAARNWNVATSKLTTKDGVISGPGGKSCTYGEIAAAAADLSPVDVTLKPRSQFKIIGHNARRLDSWPKVTGSATFGIDVKQQGMLIATMVHAPVLGQRPTAIDPGPARAVAGFHAAFLLPTCVAVVCERYWQARQAADLVKITWDTTLEQKFTSAEHLVKMRALLASEKGTSKNSHGDIQKASKGAVHTVKAQYEVPFLAHATMEPMNCTAYMNKAEGRLYVWLSTQNPALVHAVAADAANLSPSDVIVETTLLGGGFGRRLEADYAEETVQLAMLLDRPVKVVWSREEDMRNDYYRPAAVALFEGGTDAEGHITHWHNTLATQNLAALSVPQVAVARFPGWLGRRTNMWLGSVIEHLRPEDLTTGGAAVIPYATGAFDMRYVQVDAPVRVGSWRSVEHSFTGFFVESFMSELAHASGQDGFEFRRRLLEKAGATRHLKVLERVARMADWGRHNDTRHLGIALHECFGSVCAQVVEVHVQGTDIRVPRVYCVLDCGLAVAPDNVIAQLQGGIVFALSAALYGKITIKDGKVEQESFDSYQVVRLNECPTMDVALMDSDAPPSGAGEPGVPPLAPALADAIFKATGRRLRSLPLTLET